MEENKNTPTPQENEAAQNASVDETDCRRDLPEAENVEQNSSTLVIGRWIFVTSLLLVAAILLTYTLTSAAWRCAYTEKLLEQQQIIQGLSEQDSSSVAENFEILSAILENYSFYSETMDGEAMLKAAYKAYVAASGDSYARYYTEEEYQKIQKSNQAELYGIGLGVVEYSFRKPSDTEDRLGFYIREIYEGSAAAEHGIQVGDWIFAVEIDGRMQMIDEIGFDAAEDAFRSEESSSIRVQIYRPDDQGGEILTSEALTKQKFESRSVEGTVLESDPTVGIVRIKSFDLKTPTQFKSVMQSLLDRGVSRFVFDLRDNLGGDLQSIKAIVSYFLQKGDLVLDAIDRDGVVAETHCVEAVAHWDPTYADCNVSENEIGMYADLDMVVLCNESTASAAEVFVATMQDYGLAKVIGTQTYGKGIMQSTRRVALADAAGYIKFTAYAYQTKRGTSYHGVGITPDHVVELSAAAKEIPLLLLEQEQDEQLKTAVQILTDQQ